MADPRRTRLGTSHSVFRAIERLGHDEDFCPVQNVPVRGGHPGERRPGLRKAVSCV